MSSNILYHNPRWGKSRGAVALLKDNGIKYTLVEYLKDPPSVKEIMSLSKKLGLAPGEFVRRSEKEFIENNLESIMHDHKKMASFISKFPKILERPIFISNDKAIIARPPENILKLI